MTDYDGQDYVRPEEKPNDDGMLMLSSLTVIGVGLIVAMWCVYRGLVWLAAVTR